MDHHGVVSGSSPRLRGTGNVQTGGLPQTRFIPAPAGNRANHRAATDAPPVHPRACGEQVATIGDHKGFAGSSPRLRGTGNGGDNRAGHGRFIPAPAGNSARSPTICTLGAVHPRACGEQLHGAVFGTSAIGSSPRLRGTAVGLLIQPQLLRFIPAPAGNSLMALAIR